MIFGLTAIALAAQLAVRPAEIAGHELRQETQYRAYGHPPPCGNGFDLDARDGMCYPNGMVPPQFQTGRRYYGGGGEGYGRYPVPCGHGADLDIRDGRCYPNGAVPPQFQQGRVYSRQPPYEDDYDYDDRPRRRYYREY
jgi:hypothetical protein